jgi:hypothetical protein
LKLQNTKIENLQSSQVEKQTPLLPLCETSHKKLKTPKMIRRKLKNFENSKYQNKKPPKLTKERQIPLLTPL